MLAQLVSKCMNELLTVAEISEKLKVNEQTVRNWIDRGELPSVRVGGATRQGVGHSARRLPDMESSLSRVRATFSLLALVWR